MLNLLRNSAARKKNGRALYDGLVSRAREPVFFADFGVADSIDGRFDVLAFHVLKAVINGQTPSPEGED